MKLISILLIIVLIASLVSALEAQEKDRLMASLDQFKNDPVNLRILLTLMSNMEGVSDDPELVQKAETTASALDINIDEEFPYIKSGAPEDLVSRPPAPPPQVKEARQPEAPPTQEPAEKTITTTETTTQPEIEEEDLMTPIIIIAAIVVGLIIFWLYKRRGQPASSLPRNKYYRKN